MGGKRARRGTPVREVEGVEEETEGEKSVEDVLGAESARGKATMLARWRIRRITADACGVQRGAVAELDSDS